MIKLKYPLFEKIKYFNYNESIGDIMTIEKRTIQTSEIGYNFKIRPSDLINLIQDVEGKDIEKVTKTDFATEKADYSIVLNFRYVEIKRWPKYKDQLEIHSFPMETNAFYGYRNTIIYDEYGKPLIESYSLGSFINLDTLKPYRMSEEQLKGIGEHHKYEMNIVGRKIDLNREFEFVKEVKITVQASHIDYFQQLNNAFYIEFAVNQLPLEFEFNRLFAEHKLPFVMFDEMTLVTQKTPDSYVVLFLNKERKIYAVFEF